MVFKKGAFPPEECEAWRLFLEYGEQRAWDITTIRLEETKGPDRAFWITVRHYLTALADRSRPIEDPKPVKAPKVRGG